jgi:hypothetical protein
VPERTKVTEVMKGEQRPELLGDAHEPQEGEVRATLERDRKAEASK